MKTNPFAFLANQLESRLPEPLRPIHNEIKKAAQRAVQAPLEQLDLIPRAEFDAQSRELHTLERRIAELENRLAALNPPQT